MLFKIKMDSKGNIKHFKARVVTKGYTQKKKIKKKYIFSPLSSKDSFRIIMVLVAHYNLKLHHMDIKIAFLDGDLCKEVYI